MPYTAHKRILVAVTGISPAILTETVWALAEQDVPWIPDQIVAVTTRTGKAAIEKLLLDGGGWDRLRKKLRTAFSQPELIHMLIPSMKDSPGSLYPPDKIEVLLK